jgi:Circadian oscillating protein COP23
MKLSKILLTASLSIPAFLSLTYLSSAASKYNYSFICYPSPKSGIYSTQIAFSDGKNIDIIYWIKHPNFKAQCKKVSNKFQEFKERRRLNYLASGTNTKGQRIICGLVKEGDTCDDSSKIFDLIPGTSLESTIKGLGETIKGGNSPIYQGADDEFIINFEDLIDKIRQQQEKKP